MALRRQLIGIHLFDDVEELDVAGPWEVLASWSRNFPADRFDVVTFADRSGPVVCAKGMRIVPDQLTSRLPRLDVLVYPGGRGTRPALRDAEHLEWVRRMRRETELMTSVCTGSLVYAAAGLLAGRPATTHHSALAELAALDPTVEVRGDARYVDDGDVVTSSGVSAGIDMALHLVDRLAGTDRARQVRRAIQYDPQPPV
jgi:transcriptional regulator GlxA family with amidase domain